MMKLLLSLILLLQVLKWIWDAMKWSDAMKTWDDLLAEVQDTENVEDAALVAIDAIHTELTAAQGDPVKIQAAIDGLGSRRQRLAAAIANPPADTTGSGGATDTTVGATGTDTTVGATGTDTTVSSGGADTTTGTNSQ